MLRKQEFYTLKLLTNYTYISMYKYIHIYFFFLEKSRLIKIHMRHQRGWESPEMKVVFYCDGLGEEKLSGWNPVTPHFWPLSVEVFTFKGDTLCEVPSAERYLCLMGRLEWDSIEIFIPANGKQKRECFMELKSLAKMD